MPLFTHKCLKCGHQFEVLVRGKQIDETQRCEKCDAETTRIAMPGSFSLRGGGWAQDGYVKGAEG
jgi:putative FmdB family regulatory protein